MNDPHSPAPPPSAPASPELPPRVRRAATVLFALYLVVLAGAAFLPLPFGQVARGDGPSWNLELGRPDLLGGWEAQRNVLMTVPFGVLLPLVVRWRYEALIAACVGVTLLIETGQLLISTAVGWSWRAFDVNDLLLNTVGGLLGLALTGVVLAVVRRPARPPLLRLVPGALAVALVAWSVAGTVAERAVLPPEYACDAAPTRAVTDLPGGGQAYAGPRGSVCLLLGDGTSSVPADEAAGPALSFEQPEGTWEIGTAQPGDVVTDGVGGEVLELHAVEGSTVLVWSVRR